MAIHYCTKCRFILRASWLAQELSMTFAEQLREVALVPASGGVFDIFLDEELVFSRKQQQRFPESSELKQLIRDRVNPDMSLGHSDND